MNKLTASVLMLVCLVLVGFGTSSLAWSPRNLQWTSWDKEHSVETKETWMVIREPGRATCYLKQSYAGPRMMDLTVDESGTPCLWGPFSATPVDIQVQYEVDNLHQGQTKAKNITNGIRLPRDLVEFLRRGFLLTVKVQPLDPQVELGTVQEQEFSLLGFIAATEVLATEACQPQWE